jgi:hypothetical protein
MSVVPFPLSRQRGWIAKHLNASRNYSSVGMSSYLARRIEEHRARLGRAGVDETVIDRDIAPVYQRFVNAVADRMDAEEQRRA